MDGHQVDVVHHRVRVAENMVVEALQYEGFLCPILFKINAIGVVYVPGADGRCTEPAVKAEEFLGDGIELHRKKPLSFQLMALVLPSGAIII